MGKRGEVMKKSPKGFRKPFGPYLNYAQPWLRAKSEMTGISTSLPL